MWGEAAEVIEMNMREQFEVSKKPFKKQQFDEISKRKCVYACVCLESFSDK